MNKPFFKFFIANLREWYLSETFKVKANKISRPFLTQKFEQTSDFDKFGVNIKLQEVIVFLTR